MNDRLPHKATVVLASADGEMALAYQRYNLGETQWYDATGPDDIETDLHFKPTRWLEIPVAPAAPTPGAAK